MFFLASKIAWSLLSPLNLIAVMVFGGLALRRLSWWRSARLFFSAGLALFILIGIFPFGADLLTRLETRYPRPDVLPARVTGILILGGALDTDLSAAHDYPAMGPNAQRIVEGVRLARLYPEAKLVFSGGENSLAGQGLPEAIAVQSYLQRYGMAVPGRIVYESYSRNTAENFAYSEALLHPKTGETWILVTSAFHMPRAMVTARAAGWPPMIAWPANYLTDDRWRWLPDDFNLTAHFFLADIALREYAGLLAYRLFHPA